jgi:hypothetical protein
VREQGTDLAALHHMSTKLSFAVAFFLGLFSSLALPTRGAVEAVACAVSWINVSGIAEFAAAANALAIVP